MDEQFDRAKLLKRLAAIVSPAAVRTDPAEIDEVSWDAISEGRFHPRQRPQVVPPLCVVRPAATAEVRAIVLLANETGVPIVPYGGGSGLMGGALSVQPAITLDLRSMGAILEVDVEGRLVRAQAGAVLEALEQRLNQEGLILGHDPWTLPVATLGGAISTNSVGYRAGIYGAMGEQVLGLEAVLPDGEILRTRAVPKSSAGIDLNWLLIGGEGCFGIITEATLRVFPAPAARLLSAFGFDSFEQGYRAIQRLFHEGLQPALLDFGDADGEARLYLGFEGIPQVVREQQQLAAALCRDGGGRKLPEREAQSFWDERHEVARRFMQRRRDRRNRSRDGVLRDWIHVALPASRVLAFREAARDLIERRGVTLQESGLWVRPELFSMRLGVNDSGEDAQLALEETLFELLRLVQEMGGSMEYTHGVGVKLAPLMEKEHGYGLEIMRRIKKSLDPKGIMNPGKMGL
ncbi:MAG TPA: FAD-binding oxidoreductase [candidate division Zixibacteria bacterium]|nr:FAD-binding oxidoreductase [candidate division Zixibacteria bacterium]